MASLAGLSEIVFYLECIAKDPTDRIRILGWVVDKLQSYIKYGPEYGNGSVFKYYLRQALECIEEGQFDKAAERVYDAKTTYRGSTITLNPKRYVKQTIPPEVAKEMLYQKKERKA